MATKRMFSKDITSSDAFLDMPASTQALYFHLGMEADDDGFIGNPKKIMKVIGVGEDDLKILITKRFVLLFPSGVLVVKHHRINNKWDKYNCKRTMYLDEFGQLNIKENRAYTLDKSQGTPVQSENSLLTVSRIEENRIIPAKADSSLQRRVVSEDSEGKEKEPRKAKNKVVLSLREKCYDRLEEEHGVRPTPTFADYNQLLIATLSLKEKDVLNMLEDAIAKGTAQTVRGIFTSREIDIYRQENL